MAFNITDFTSRFTFDGARPNLFEVQLGGMPESAKFLCKATQLPGSTLGIAPVFYFGREVKVAGNRTFPEWTVTILNDEDFLIRNILEGYMGSINGHESNQATALYANYAGKQTYVRQYSKTGEVVKTYNFVGMFPIDIAPIDLDWGSNDTIEEYTVTFAYQYWNSDESDVG